MKWRKLPRRLFPRAVRNRLERLGWLSRRTYDHIVVRPADIQQGAYKAHLGGGAEAWDRRGEFQLHFLQQAGLQPQHRLLDIGCGPLRAGQFFIRYLEPENVTAHPSQLFVGCPRSSIQGATV